MSKEIDRISVPLDDHVRAIAQEAGRAAAREVLDDHTDACKIHDVAKDLYGVGPNDPGLKQHVAEMRTAAGGVRAVLRYILAPVLAAVVTAAAMALFFSRAPVNHAQAGTTPAAASPPGQGVRP